MARVLHIKATPRGEESRTMKLADAFFEAYRAANPGDEIETLDLFKADIPEFDALAAEGKYRVMTGSDHSGEEAQRWQRVVEAAEPYRAAHGYGRTGGRAGSPVCRDRAGPRSRRRLLSRRQTTRRGPGDRETAHRQRAARPRRSLAWAPFLRYNLA